jgi:predicted RNase H-like HicB family nuclease
MERKKVFLVSITQEGKFFVAQCPEPGVTSQGGSLAEAQKNLKEAIELYIERFGLEDLPEVALIFLTARTEEAKDAFFSRRLWDHGVLLDGVVHRTEGGTLTSVNPATG